MLPKARSPKAAAPESIRDRRPPRTSVVALRCTPDRNLKAAAQGAPLPAASHGHRQAPRGAPPARRPKIGCPAEPVRHGHRQTPRGAPPASRPKISCTRSNPPAVRHGHRQTPRGTPLSGSAGSQRFPKNYPEELLRPIRSVWIILLWKTSSQLIYMYMSIASIGRRGRKGENKGRHRRRL